MLTFNGVTSERADEILSSLDKNVLEKLAEVLGNIGASTFFIEEVFNKHNYLNTVAYFVIPMVGVGTGKVVLVYVDEADVVGLNTTFEGLNRSIRRLMSTQWKMYCLIWNLMFILRDMMMRR